MLASLALAILARAVTLTAARRGFDSVQYVHSARATLIADAANQFVIDELSRDVAFESDINSQTLTTMGGSFSVDFVPAGTNSVGALQSVNNLEGTDYVNGPRGEDTVAPGTLDLVVLVDTGSETRIFETLVRSPGAATTGSALQGAGRIRLRGNVSIDGIQSPSSDAQVEAGMHSGVTDNSAASIISWFSSEPGDEANISGEVTTATTSPLAINMTGANIAGGTQTGVPSPPVTDPEIANTIAGKTSATPFSPPGIGTVSPGNGEFYSGGNISINGDLVLDGTELFIDGDLTVNGSIYGEGTVWVSGGTTFKGDSVIRTTDRSVSLMSHGNVKLDGFGGMEYLEAVVDGRGDPLLSKTLDDTQTALEGLETSLVGASSADLEQGNPLDDATQVWRRVLGDPNTAPQQNGAPPGMELNTLATLRDALSSEPPGPTRDFMVAKLDSLHRGFMESNDLPGTEPAKNELVLQQWLSGDMSGGAYWDCLTEYNNSTGNSLPPEVLPQLLNYGREVTFDKLGSSTFRGTVYTDGSFLAENEVAVLGQVIATGENSNAGDQYASDGTGLEPGDIMLGNGCHITFCQEFADDAQAAASPSAWQIAVWIER